MTDPTNQPRISDETAMLIERAVRGDLSPEEQARLDGLVSADPVVATELERAEREEDAMNTAAMLMNERSDPERMRKAIEQKLGLDLRMNLLMGSGLLVAIPVYLLLLHGWGQRSDLAALGALVPLVAVVVYLLLNLRRQRAFRKAVAAGESALAEEFTRHLHRSCNGYTITRAAFIIVGIALPLVVLEDIVNGNFARAIVLVICGSVLLLGLKTAFRRTQKERYDKFFEGRLTLEELFENNATTTESDGE
jgi:hypothetical protein